MKNTTRRTFTRILSAAVAASFTQTGFGQRIKGQELIKKLIPSSGKQLVPIGMGTWQTFNVGSDRVLRDERTKVLNMFFEMGGQLIDSSPMYGSSQEVLGYALQQLDSPPALFSADKVWTSNGSETLKQASENASKWGLEKFDLLQVHNLLSWQEHLESLRQMRRDNELGYVGVTTSHGRRHADLETILQTEKLDFVQLTYNLEDREAERRLLPLAKEKGIAVIVNRPFQGGRLIRRLQRNNAPLPGWAKEYQCYNWAQLLLKFIISHPAVSCAIPATTQVAHMRENMGTANGPLLDDKTRKALLDHMGSL